MTTAAAEQLEIINHIPSGGRVILHGVNWEEYKDLINGLGDDSHLRISFSDGRLEIMSPSTPHEKYKSLIDRLVVAISDELGIDVISFGSFTMKIDRLRKGAEADDCFYIQHAPAMIGRDHLELGADPPPDLVVEIDLTSDSRKKFDIYASFAVPEIWRFDGRALTVFQLREGQYHQSEFALCFPSLSASRITELIAGVSSGTHQSWRDLHEWLRANKPSNS